MEPNQLNFEYPQYNTLIPNHCREIYIKLNYSEFYGYLMNNYPSDILFQEKLYWFYKDLKERPVCKKCGNKVKFINTTTGYSDYCSVKCSNSSEKKIEDIKKTNNKKYGGNAPACSVSVINKMKQTNLEKYGDPNYNNREGAKITMIEKYGGVGNASAQTKAKQYKTMLEKYGKENSMQVESVKQKMRENNKEKYGVSWVFQREDVKQKSIRTCIERYGACEKENISCVSQLETVKKHIKENTDPCINQGNHDKYEKTCIEKYGVPNVSSLESVKAKIKETCLERYGVCTPLITKEARKKAKQTCIEKYGVSSPSQLESVKIKIADTKRKNHTFNTSSIEKAFEKYLNENNIEYKSQYRSEKYPFCCDFYIVKHDLYIEIQGMWTHGGHPYNIKNQEDIEKLNGWKLKNNDFYNSAIKTWTFYDPKKRKAAKENNLRYLEVFTTDINKLIYEYKRTVERF